MTPYERRLATLWKAHCAQRRRDAPTAITLFTGGGGASLGISAAGFREVLAVEMDDIAVKTFCLNFPDVPVWADDICAMSVGEALRIARLKRGELDLLQFSPPCQADSEAGNQSPIDPRTHLWKPAARLIHGIQPRHIIMEGVVGLTQVKLRPKFDEMIRIFEASGYVVAHAVLDCSQFGIPTMRRRLIIHGVRRDLGIKPLLPTPDEHGKVLTVTNAWEGLPQIQPRTSALGQLAALVPKIKPGSDGRHTHPLGHFWSTKRLDWNKPAYSVCALVSRCQGLLIHPDLDFCVSINEIARIQSFPDQFRFVGTWQQRWRVIGNAVPPLLGWEIAKCVRGSSVG